jgi:diketogulonate reductase-like aldo/keto reductase
MQIPEINIQDLVSIPRLGLGTWEMGGRSQADSSEDNKWIDAIQMALAYGIRHIDTAEIYGNGHSEELVSVACAGIRRDSLFITTKVSGDNLKREQLVRAAEASLNRLRTDYIDLYLLHWPNSHIPIADTMAGIHQLLESGRIKHFGLSNFSVKLMQEVMDNTDYPIITNQVEYNLINRNNGTYNKNVEKEIIPFCQKHGISITAWRPVVKGDKTALDQPKLISLAEKYGKTPMQIALNWLVNKPQMLAIPKMSSEKHIRENVEAVNFSLTEAEYLMLDDLSS